MRKALTLLSGLAVFTFGSTAATAGTIYACVHDQNGKVRIVDAPGLCHGTEYEISWSESGDLEQLVNSLIGRVEALEDALGIFNEPPTVDCGNDFSTLINQPVVVECVATDDGVLSPLTYQWSQISGPSDVTFADWTSPISEVWFADPGEYVLELAADDGYVTVKSQISIVVYLENQEPSISIYGATTYQDDTGTIHCWAAAFVEVLDDGLPEPLSLDVSPAEPSALPFNATINWYMPNYVSVLEVYLTEPGRVVYRIAVQNMGQVTSSSAVESVIYDVILTATDGQSTVATVLPVQCDYTGE